MDSLPPEILYMVGALLDRDDVPVFRLVSRSFAEIGIHHITVGKHFCFRKHSLYRLNRLSQHPILRTKLRDITLFVNVVPKFESMFEWEDQALVTCSSTSEDDPLALKWLESYHLHDIIRMKEVGEESLKDAAWHIHQRIRLEQEELLSCPNQYENFFGILRGILPRFPRLRIFSLDTYGKCHQEVLRPLSIVTESQTWYSYNKTCALESFNLVFPNILNAALSNDYIERSIGLTMVQPLQLEIYGSDFACFEQDKLDPSLYTTSLARLRLLRFVSAPLHRLLSARESSNYVHTFSDERNGSFIQQILSKTPCLLWLHIDVWAKPDLNSQTILRDCIWPKLWYVQLRQMTIHQPSFEKFLLLHAGSLKELHFYRIYLEGSSHEYAWIEFFKFMKYSLHLNQLVFGSILVGKNNGLRFAYKMTHVLTSGSSISMRDVVRYLVLECEPSFFCDDAFLADAEELRELTWQVLEDAQFAD